ncbi:MAG: zinc-ribbon domain-containing protein [Candidatus Phaeomarinobacter sp.]
MIITCPECDTRYTVKAAAFKAPGRKVRCASCGNEWFQEPPEDAPKPVELEEPPAPDPAPEPAPEPDPVPDVAPEPVPEPEAAGEDVVEEAPVASKPVITRPAPVDDAPPMAEEEFAPTADASLPDQPSVFKPTQAPKQSRAILLGWAALFLFVFVFFGSLIAFRGDVARYWPATASLYDAIGLPVVQQDIGLRNISKETTVENGLTVLSITGEIINTGEERGAVPRVRVALRDREGLELYHYFFALPEAELDPGASAEFVTRLSSPPAAADHLVLRFVEPGEYTGNEVPVASDGS